MIMIPSSVHEWILLPQGEVDSVEEIKEIIVGINRSCVEPEEVLSDKVYLYKAGTGQVEIAA